MTSVNHRNIWEVAFNNRGRPMSFLQIAYLMIAVSYVVAVVAMFAGH
ncbi:hypothetical protein FHT82_005290 [Rhizobium sp. BK275]|nr:hypothetical protein [Rhizobium sp. BK275]MBB3392503.1 hypothetical protein [Rhizobium sp. BK275]